jgi:hypothetical protein
VRNFLVIVPLRTLVVLLELKSKRVLRQYALRYLLSLRS